MIESNNVHTSPIHTGERHFKFFEAMDAVLLAQDEANEQQRIWREHDDAMPIGEAAVGDVEVPPNQYL